MGGLNETIKHIEENGGKLIHGPNHVPTVGMHAYCSDPEGNIFGVMQMDAK